MDEKIENSADSNTEQSWERGWSDHEQQQLERLSKLTLAQKLAWLEEAHRLVRQLEAARRSSESFEQGRSDPFARSLILRT